jgi:hypothetical protein
MNRTPTIVTAYAGEVIPGTLDSAGSTAAGWTLEWEGCDVPPGWAAPVISSPSTDHFEWEFDTAGWPPATYHFLLWKRSPDPEEVIVDLWVNVQGC